jgi:hypothetical protein
MAIVTNTFTTFDAKGIREDLSNIITNIAPEETPYMSNIGRESISNSLFEFQSDTLAAAAANKQIEGDDVASFDAVTATVRLQNYAQISRKTIILSATEEVVNKAGRRSELAYQIAKRGSELKRDQEFTMLNGAVAAAGNTSTARGTASRGAVAREGSVTSGSAAAISSARLFASSSASAACSGAPSMSVPFVGVRVLIADQNWK